MSTSSKWFIREGNKMQGPFTEDELQLLAKSGKISSECMVARNNGSNQEWLNIDALPGLAELIDIDGRKFLMLKSGNYAATKATKSQSQSSQTAPRRLSLGGIFGAVAIVFAVLSLVLYQRFGLAIPFGIIAFFAGAFGFFSAASTGGYGIRISFVGLILGVIGLILSGTYLAWELIR
jgi:GYF domain 2